MNRREFLLSAGLAGAAAAWPLERVAWGSGPAEVPLTESRKAYRELLDLAREIDLRFLSSEWKVERPEDIAAGHRYILHMQSFALDLLLEADPERPVFQRMVWPFRKFMGDNPDAIYYAAYIRPDRTYRVRGNTAGAVYTSVTLELGTAQGNWPRGVARAINDTELKVAPDGSYEVILGPEPRPGNWFKLDPEVGSLTTRHYFEEERCVAADLSRVIPLSIEPLDPPAPRPAPDDASIAAGIRRVVTFLRSTTLDMPPFLQPGKVPNWVSTVPNRFNQPEKPGPGIGASLQDAAYAMAPYALKPDEALVIEGRFPKCRFASVDLWNRFQQTYDYVTRPVSRNRKQTTLERNGSFKMVVAHRDPGVPNWLDTEGRAGGLLYWRFILPEEPVAPLKTRVVPFAKVARGAKGI